MSRQNSTSSGRSSAARSKTRNQLCTCGSTSWLLVIPQKPWDVVEADFEAYHGEWAKQHTAPPPPPLCGGFCFVDENADLQNLNDMPVELNAFAAGQLVEVKGNAGSGDTLWISRMHMDNN